VRQSQIPVGKKNYSASKQKSFASRIKANSLSEIESINSEDEEDDES
jgi:hypothetical protein